MPSGTTAAAGVSGPAPLTRPGDHRWVEQSFSKRDCTRYVTSTKDVAQCACGQTWAYHKTHGVESVGETGEVWAPAYHTVSSPTDAFGTIDFLGGPHPNKAQFIRLGFDSRPDLILQLLTREWGLELPKLIISVHGGKANFELNPRLKRVFRKGLLRAAKTTGKRNKPASSSCHRLFSTDYDRRLDLDGRHEHGRDSTCWRRFNIGTVAKIERRSGSQHRYRPLGCGGEPGVLDWPEERCRLSIHRSSSV